LSDQRATKELTMNFTTLPDYVFPATPGAFGALETAIELAGLTGKWVRLSAADQRRLMGFAPFGKREVRVDSDSIISLRHRIAFGSDYSRGEYESSTVRAACAAGKLLCPDSTGPRYYSAN
jgi:hypothetical protein